MTSDGYKVVAFDAKEFFQLSIRIVGSEPNEAGYRTAINRAYYACHLVGCVSVAKKGWFRRTYGPRDHHNLYKALEQHTSWGSQLRSLYELREHADYHIGNGNEGSGNDCPYCRNNSCSVDKDTWERAKVIAGYVLPRISNI